MGWQLRRRRECLGTWEGSFLTLSVLLSTMLGGWKVLEEASLTGIICFGPLLPPHVAAPKVNMVQGR